VTKGVSLLSPNRTPGGLCSHAAAHNTPRRAPVCLPRSPDSFLRAQGRCAARQIAKRWPRAWHRRSITAALLAMSICLPTLLGSISHTHTEGTCWITPPPPSAESFTTAGSWVRGHTRATGVYSQVTPRPNDTARSVASPAHTHTHTHTNPPLTTDLPTPYPLGSTPHGARAPILGLAGLSTESGGVCVARRAPDLVRSHHAGPRKLPPLSGAEPLAML
jgi:hypothetical protein